MVIASNSNKIILLPTEHSTQFQLIDLFVALPTQKPNPISHMQARPFEFTLDMPSKFSAMCPFCCAGFYVSACDIIDKYGYKFVWCPECGAGKEEMPAPLPMFVDPFVNPFDSKQLTRCELDETVTSIDNVINDNSLTVAQKMSRKECAE
jgi:hypothetical protein